MTLCYIFIVTTK